MPDDRKRSKWGSLWSGESFPDESRQTDDPPVSQIEPGSEDPEAYPHTGDTEASTADNLPEMDNQSSSVDESRPVEDSHRILDVQTRWSLIIFGIGYAVWAICQILYLGKIAVLEDLNFSGPFPTYSVTEFQAVLDRLAEIGILEVVALFVMAGAVIYFFFQSYRSIQRLGAADLRYPASQTIWTWFVPILNLFRPKQIANDIWRASTSLDLSAPKTWREAPVTAAMTAWWTFWIIGGIISSRLFFVDWGRESTTPGWEITLIYAGFFVFVLHSVAAALLVHFMIRVRDAQAALSQRVYQGPPEGYVELPSPEEEA